MDSVPDFSVPEVLVPLVDYLVDRMGSRCYDPTVVGFCDANDLFMQSHCLTNLPHVIKPLHGSYPAAVWENELARAQFWKEWGALKPCARTRVMHVVQSHMQRTRTLAGRVQTLEGCISLTTCTSPHSTTIYHPHRDKYPIPGSISYTHELVLQQMHYPDPSSAVTPSYLMYGPNAGAEDGPFYSLLRQPQPCPSTPIHQPHKTPTSLRFSTALPTSYLTAACLQHNPLLRPVPCDEGYVISTSGKLLRYRSHIPVVLVSFQNCTVDLGGFASSRLIFNMPVITRGLPASEFGILALDVLGPLGVYLGAHTPWSMFNHAANLPILSPAQRIGCLHLTEPACVGATIHLPCWETKFVSQAPVHPIYSSAARQVADLHEARLLVYSHVHLLPCLPSVLSVIHILLLSRQWRHLHNCVARSPIDSEALRGPPTTVDGPGEGTYTHTSIFSCGRTESFHFLPGPLLKSADMVRSMSPGFDFPTLRQPFDFPTLRQPWLAPLLRLHGTHPLCI
jgi:hypothetical protein